MSSAKEKKMKEVEEMKKLFEKHSVFGIVDMFKLPTVPIQKVKKKSGKDISIKMTKKAVLVRSLEDIKAKKKGFEEFSKLIPKQPAIVFTEMDPFKFYAMVDKLKVPAAAKEGDIAPADIEIHAGPTNLLAGPAISELTKVGIPAGVEEGKISVKKDVVVAKKGSPISKPLANALKKLGVEPMAIGINVVAIYQNGMIYSKDVLSLVGETYMNKIREAFTQALNLSVSIGYPTKSNISYLLAKAKLAADAIESKISLDKPKAEAQAQPENKNESGGTS